MGWSFAYHDVGRKEHIRHLSSQSRFGSNWEYLKTRVVGNHLWHLARNLNSGRKIIFLDLIAKERGGGWGEKGMSEDCGPNYYDCPLSLLKEASPATEGFAVGWRKQVEAYHAAKKKRTKHAEGDLVRYGGFVYRLMRSFGRKGWEVRPAEGLIIGPLRMTSRQLGKAEQLEKKMGTRARIGRINEDGTVTSIYTHWDGYPEHHAPILLGAYDTPAKLKKLFALGDLSTLGSELGEKHDFDEPLYNTEKKDWCKSYGRDRGEPAPATMHSGLGEFYESANPCDFIYLAKGKPMKWFYAPLESTDPIRQTSLLRPLSEYPEAEEKDIA